jgi:excisionase family DNA binding protein
MGTTPALDEPLDRPRLYTVREFAAFMHVSPSHAYEMIAQGQVPGTLRLGRVIRVNLDVFLAQESSDGEA